MDGVLGSVVKYSVGVSRLPKPDCSKRSCYLPTSGGGRASSLSLTLACWKMHRLNQRSELTVGVGAGGSVIIVITLT